MESIEKIGGILGRWTGVVNELGGSVRVDGWYVALTDAKHAWPVIAKDRDNQQFEHLDYLRGGNP